MSSTCTPHYEQREKYFLLYSKIMHLLIYVATHTHPHTFYIIIPQNSKIENLINKINNEKVSFLIFPEDQSQLSFWSLIFCNLFNSLSLSVIIYQRPSWSLSTCVCVYLIHKASMIVYIEPKKQ